LVYLSDEGKNLKSSIQSNFSTFKLQHKTKINVLKLKSQENLSKIKGKVDLRKEQLKKQIDDISAEFIQNIKYKEGQIIKTINEKSCLEETELEFNFQNIQKEFRNPSLNLSVINEITSKLDSYYSNDKRNFEDLVQSISNSLNRIEFISADFTMDKNLFGKIDLNKNQILIKNELNDQFSHLNEHSRFDPFKSEILTNDQPMDLIKLCEFNRDDKFKLLYRGTQHGFGANDFHSKCDGHANTLTIIKVKGNGFIFGAFTTATWDSSSKYKSDPNAFLFSLTNKDNKSCKIKIDTKKHKHAICYDN